MDIRPARAGDAAQIAVVHVRSWQGAYRGLLPQEYLDGLDPAQRRIGWERALRETDWSRGGIVVAEDGGALAGFAGFGPTRDEDEDAGRVGEVEAIYLLPAAWGKGAGRQLMAAALTGLAGAGYGQATLWVLDSNVRARRFYEAGGWAADGARKQDGSRGFPLTELRYRRPLP
jgi:GNAT superfamily N-acetyltransferase